MHTKGVFLVGFLVKLNYTKLTPFILLYSNIYLNFHPTFFSLRAKFRLVFQGSGNNREFGGHLLAVQPVKKHGIARSADS
jgi:hypothetical protein